MNEITIRCFDASLVCSLSSVGDSVSGQIPEPTPAAARLESFARMLDQAEGSLFNNVEFRSIGPTVMSGRIVDLDVSPHDPTHFYVAYASGGLWKTTSNGTNFKPVFEDQALLTIGDIAVSWSDPEVVYVGTGENNSSRSSYSGTGVYRSRDGGESWRHLGLGETHHPRKGLRRELPRRRIPMKLKSISIHGIPGKSIFGPQPTRSGSSSAALSRRLH